MRVPLLLSVVLTSTALAHDGPRVWIGNDNGTTRTYTSDDDLDPTSYSPSQVFTGALSPFFGVYTTEFPGYEVRRDGGAVPADTLFGFQMAGPLLLLEPAQNRVRPAREIFPSEPPQIGVTLSETTLVSDTGFQPGYDFLLFGGVGDHAHLSFTLLGEGGSPTAPTPDGAYVLPMILTSSRLERSDWYFLVLGKNATTTHVSQAAALATVMSTAGAGDTNFDAQVNFDDLLTLAQNYASQAGKWWADGDFDFDGDVDFDDLLGLAQNYGSGALAQEAFEADWRLAQSLAPEPTAMTALLAAALIRRRRL